MEQCDGLRGPLVIYDPHDPLTHMHDVDDGEGAIDVYQYTDLSCVSPASTVITPADW